MVKPTTSPVNRLRLLHDLPLHEGDEGDSPRDDGLNFLNYAQVLAKAVAGTPGPFTIGILGEWGMGKTSLMRLVQDELPEDNNVTVWFNAWQYEREEHPLIPLIGTILNRLEEEQTFLDNLGDQGKKLIRAGRALIYGLSGKLEIEIPAILKAGVDITGKEIVDRYEKLIPEPLTKTSLYYNAYQSLAKVKLPTDRRIVVLIDDLDRCFPNNAIRLLESIKLVLNQPGFIFILGLSRAVLEGYLKHRYEKSYGLEHFDGAAYLDKIVQLSFPIPSHAGRMTDLANILISGLDASHQEGLKTVLPLVAEHLDGNPRSLVRLINNLLIDFEISSLGKGSGVDIKFFAVTRCMQMRWPEFCNLVAFNDVAAKRALELSDPSKPHDAHDQNSIHSYLYSLILKDADLMDFLQQGPVKDWLTESKIRKKTIQFLRDSLRENEPKRLMRGTSVLTLVAGDTKEVAESFKQAMHRSRILYSENLWTNLADFPDAVKGKASTWNPDELIRQFNTIQPSSPSIETRVLVYAGQFDNADRLFSAIKSKAPEIITFSIDPGNVFEEAHRILSSLFGNPGGIRS